MADTDAYVNNLTGFEPLQGPIVAAAIRALDLPAGSRGLDAGCGVGLQTLPLAEAVGPAGHVTGLDISAELLHHAEIIVEDAGLSERISFRKGDVSRLPFDEDTFDWAWSCNCVGYAAFLDSPAVLKELARVVKPGGTVALIAWSSEQLLPGYPLLEARLKATTPGLAPFVEGKEPGTHFLRALGWFREAGLEVARAETLAGGAHAPLDAAEREALVMLLAMRWPGVESELAPEDRAEYQRLCLPQSPDFILDHPDYYAFFTYSLFWGTVAHLPLERP